MNVILVKEGIITTPNGKQKDTRESFELLQTQTVFSHKIVNQNNINKQLEEYKNAVSHMFEDETERIFNNEDDKIQFELNDDFSVPFQEVTFTAEEQLASHIKSISSWIQEAKSEGFNVQFEII